MKPKDFAKWITLFFSILTLILLNKSLLNESFGSRLSLKHKTPSELALEAWRNRMISDSQCVDNAYIYDPWIDFLFLAPPSNFIDSRMLRLLHSIGDLKLADKLCHFRIIVVTGGVSQSSVVEVLLREWAEIHTVEWHKVSSPSGSSDILRLQNGLNVVSSNLLLSQRWLATKWPSDIVFFIDSDMIIPPGFINAIKSSTRPGNSVFMPHFFELFPNASQLTSGHWVSPSPSTVLNVGVYISDAISHELYSDRPKHLPFNIFSESYIINGITINSLQIVEPRVDGFIRPNPKAKPNNEVSARKHKQMDERGKNKRRDGI